MGCARSHVQFAHSQELECPAAAAAARQIDLLRAVAQQASLNGGSQTVVVSYSGEDSDDDEESFDGRSHASWLMRSVFIFSRDDAIDEVLPRLFISGIVPATNMKVRAPRRAEPNLPRSRTRWLADAAREAHHAHCKLRGGGA